MRIQDRAIHGDFAEILGLGQEATSHWPKANTLPALLDKIASELRDAPALPDEAVSRAGIYADHP